jgi:citrate lyase subunit beta/citryl-CoA lyase
MKPNGVWPLRTMLFAPGNQTRKISNAFGVGADAVIIDLEDAVPRSEKESTRASVAQWISVNRNERTYVRVNGFNSPAHAADVESLVGLPIDGIVVPKVDTGEEIRAFCATLDLLETRAGVPDCSIDVLPIIESAAGLQNAYAIARSGTRIRRLLFGGVDYSLDLDLDVGADEAELAYARAALTNASRAAGIEAPVDTPCLQFRDAKAILDSAHSARRFGFQGKLCIHPSQVGVCNQVFTPSVAAINRAREIVTQFEHAEAAGVAAIEIQGDMIDYPVVEKARRVLAIASLLQESAPK